jgi:hypothetical protein
MFANYIGARNLFLGTRNFFPALHAVVRGARILLSHLSADVVPQFYWRRLKRWWAARRA